jgi:hypothetical protein
MARQENYLLTIDSHALRFAGKVIPLRSIAYFEKLRKRRRGSVRGLVIPLLLAGVAAGVAIAVQENSSGSERDMLTLVALAAGAVFAIMALRGFFRLLRRDHFALMVQTSAGDSPELFSSSEEAFMDELVSALTLRLQERDDLPPLIANIHNKTIRQGDTVMGDKVGGDKVGGDKFENVSGTIVNRSTLKQSMNTVARRTDDDTAQALKRIAELIEAQNNAEAAEIFESFNKELAKQSPARAVLKSLWEGLKAAMPVLGAATDITVKIVKLFD